MRPTVTTNALRLITLLLAGWAVAQAAYAAWRQDWTYDERFHLTWARRLVEEGVTERASLHRFDSKTPVSALNVLGERAAVLAGVKDARAQAWAARLPTVMWLMALLAATFALTRSMGGTTAGLIAVAMMSLDPNLIAHGSLVTVDVAYATVTVLTLWAGLRLARHPSVRTGAAVGAALGLGLVTKATGALLVPSLALLPLAAPRHDGGAPSRTSALRTVAALAMAAYVAVCAGYLFGGIGTKLGDIELTSRPLARVSAALPRGLPVPLPVGFLTGIDRSIATEDVGYKTILLGKLYPRGVWYYFAVLFLLKTPVLLIAAQCVGFAAAARRRVLWRPEPRYLLAVLALHLGYFSLLFRMQIGYRFVLMCIPLACALAAIGLAEIASGSRWRWAAAAAVVLSLLEGGAYLGNPLSFTNAAVWPKREAFRLLADSNIDWGQNRDKIQGWMSARDIPASRLNPLHPLPGANLFELNQVAGLFDFERYRWLRENADPVAHLGHTYLLFEMSDDLYDQFLQEDRLLAPTEGADGLCGAEEMARLPAGEKAPFGFAGPADARVWHICVRTDRGVDLGLRAFKGQVSVAHDGHEQEVVMEGQVAWWRLMPGSHVFVAQAVPNRRAWLPATFAGEWQARRHGAWLAIRGIASARGEGAPQPGVEPSTSTPR